jgi:hypothetical protein
MKTSRIPMLPAIAALVLVPVLSAQTRFATLYTFTGYYPVGLAYVTARLCPSTLAGRCSNYSPRPAGATHGPKRPCTPSARRAVTRARR